LAADARGVSAQSRSRRRLERCLVEQPPAHRRGRQGYQLLLRLFTDHFDAARKKLAPGQLNTLEDLFLDLMLGDNPGENFKWLQSSSPPLPILPAERSQAPRRRTAR